MVKSLDATAVNPAALEAVKPEAAASRYTYIKHNMNWTRSVLGAKNMPIYEKTARVAAAFFVALVEFFLVNGAFLFANAGIFIANQAHRAFAKQQISEIELPPSPKSPKGPFTPTVAQLSDTTPSDGQPSPAANRSPRAEDLAAAVNAAAVDVLPQPEQRQDLPPSKMKSNLSLPLKKISFKRRSPLPSCLLPQRLRRMQQPSASSRTSKKPLTKPCSKQRSPHRNSSKTLLSTQKQSMQP